MRSKGRKPPPQNAVGGSRIDLHGSAINWENRTSRHTEQDGCSALKQAIIDSHSFGGMPAESCIALIRFFRLEGA